MLTQGMLPRETNCFSASTVSRVASTSGAASSAESGSTDGARWAASSTSRDRLPLTE